MAWRNVWRNRRRTLVTVAAMSLALLSMLCWGGLIEGMLRDMERDVLDLEIGDLQVFAGDYRTNPSIYTRIEDPEALLDPLDAAGFPASARLLAYGMAAAEESSAAVSFRGVDVARDARVSRIHEQLAEGSWLDPAEPRGVVLGKRLARTLDAGPGSEVLVLSQGADGAMAYDLYTVRGVLLGVGDATDRTALFMTEAAFRELMVVPRGAHQIIVRKPAGLDLESLAAHVIALAGENEVKTWRQLLPTISSLMDSARGAMIFMFLIVYVAIGILILNSMLMAVFERIRELGVLKALGVGPFEVLSLIVLETAIQTGIAIAVGLALGAPALAYLAWEGINLSGFAGEMSIMGLTLSPIWYGAVTPQVITQPIIALIAIVGVAASYPAFKAAWIRPVDAMHHH